MKLIYYELSISFELKNGDINIFVIESPDLFEKIIMDLSCALETKEEYFSVYDEKNEKLDMRKICELILSPLDLVFDKREVQRKLFRELETVMMEDGLVEDLSKIQAGILQILDKLKNQTDYEIDFNDEMDLADMFRLYDIHIANPQGHFDEKLIEYMITLKRLAGIEVFILANCESYLSESAFAHLEKCAMYYELTIIFLTNRQIELLKSKNTYIIDVNLCEIH